jgi:hypothetical protein
MSSGPRRPIPTEPDREDDPLAEEHGRDRVQGQVGPEEHGVTRGERHDLAVDDELAPELCELHHDDDPIAREVGGKRRILVRDLVGSDPVPHEVGAVSGAASEPAADGRGELMGLERSDLTKRIADGRPDGGAALTDVEELADLGGGEEGAPDVKHRLIEAEKRMRVLQTLAENRAELMRLSDVAAERQDEIRALQREVEDGIAELARDYPEFFGELANPVRG